MDHIRIAIRDSTDSMNICFLDNKAGIKFHETTLQRFLKGTCNFLTLKFYGKDIDTIYPGCRLAFKYGGNDYWLTINSFKKNGYECSLTAYSLSLETNKEKRKAFKAPKWTFKQYLDYVDPEHSLTLGLNEVASQSMKLEWSGTDTILARLFSIANSFGAELEFVTELNDDYSLKRHVLNVYKIGNIGKDKTGMPIRVGKSLKVINYTANIDELYTAIRVHGKDGLTIAGLDKKVYDKDNNLLYYTQGDTLYAPQSRDRFPAIAHKASDSFICLETEDTEHSSKEALYAYMLGELKKHSEPKIDYETEGYVDGQIGDRMLLIDSVHYDPPLYVEARISEQTISLLDKSKNKTVFTNYERKESEIANELLAKMNALIEENKVYDVQILTSNGYSFKNGQGSTTLTARVMDGPRDVTNEFSLTWFKNSTEYSHDASINVQAGSIDELATYLIIAEKDGRERGRNELTVFNVKDGQPGKTPVVHLAWADSADGSVGFSLELPTTKIPKYRGYYVDYSTVASTNPKLYKWERNPDDAAKVADEAKDKADAADSKADSAIDTANSAKDTADEASKQTALVNGLANAAKELADKAKADAAEANRLLGLANTEISKLNTNVNNVKSDLASAETDLNSKIETVKTTLTQNYATKTNLSETKITLNKTISESVASVKQEMSETYAVKSDLTTLQGEYNSFKEETAKKISQQVSSIQTIQTDTTNAKQLANDAYSKANSAVTSATNASSTANSAMMKASDATSVANSASQNATNAVASANSAVSTANTAKNNADKAIADVAALTKTVTSQSTRIDQTSNRIDQVASGVTEVGNKVDSLKLVGENLILNGYGEFGNNKNFNNYIFDGANSYNNKPSFKTSLKTALSIGNSRIPIDINKAYQFSMNIKSDNNGKIYLGWDEYDIDGYYISPTYAIGFPNTTTSLARDLNDGDTVVYLESTANWVDSNATHQNGLIFWNYRDSTGYLYPEGVYSRNAWLDLYTKENVNKTNNTITLKSSWNHGKITAGTRVSQSNSSGHKYRNFTNTSVPTSWTNTSFRIGEDHQLQAPYNFDATRFSPAAKSIAFMGIWSYGTSVVDTYYINSVELKNIDDKLLIDGINTNLSNNYYAKTTVDSKLSTAVSGITAQYTSDITTRLGNYYDKATIDSKLTIDGQGIASYVKNTQSKLDNLQVGGRNYLTGTHKDYKKFDLGQWAAILFSRNLSDLNLKVGDYITASCDVKVPSNAIKGGKIRVQFFNSDADRTQYYGEICNIGEEKRLKATVYIDSKLLQYKRIDLLIESTNTGITAVESGIQSRHEKLEIGNMMTDWFPAPEDMATLTQYTEVKQLADQLSATVYDSASGLVTKTTQLANSYAIKQLNSSGDILTSLNLNANTSTAEIDAKLIRLNGSTKMDDAFVNKLAANSIITNKIKATEISGDVIKGGTIQGVTLKSTGSGAEPGEVEVNDGTIAMEKQEVGPSGRYFNRGFVSPLEMTMSKVGPVGGRIGLIRATSFTPFGFNNQALDTGNNVQNHRLFFHYQGLSIESDGANSGVGRNSGLKVFGDNAYIDLKSGILNDPGNDSDPIKMRIIATPNNTFEFRNNYGNIYMFTKNGENPISNGYKIPYTLTDNNMGIRVARIANPNSSGTYLELSNMAGKAWGINAWASDQRLKSNIQSPTQDALATINQLKVRQFDWKSDNVHEDFGLVAQEVEQVLPNAVFKVGDYYQIKDSGLIPVLIGAVQKLSNKVNLLENIIYNTKGSNLL
ncbi:tail fiber domain-containing protein [Enterococcus cecorum]|uniref:tail fiber domain-containing protein n=1 Tax=Enterococcus cecorum TaxID=44008 RepID=UPI003262F05D